MTRFTDRSLGIDMGSLGRSPHKPDDKNLVPDSSQAAYRRTLLDAHDVPKKPDPPPQTSDGQLNNPTPPYPGARPGVPSLIEEAIEKRLSRRKGEY